MKLERPVDTSLHSASGHSAYNCIMHEKSGSKPGLNPVAFFTFLKIFFDKYERSKKIEKFLQKEHEIRFHVLQRAVLHEQLKIRSALTRYLLY